MNTLNTPIRGTGTRPPSPNRDGDIETGSVMLEYDGVDVESCSNGESEGGKSEKSEGRDGKKENSVVGMRCVVGIKSVSDEV